MTDEQSNSDRSRTGARFDPDVERRTVLAVGGGVTATLLAGCTSESSPADEGDTDESSTDGTGAGGTFRLLISDLPADIGDFDRLDVSFDSARIFDGGIEGADDEAEADGPDDGDETDSADADDETDTTDDLERNQGFYVLDLDGATVDLTQVIGDRAMSVFEGELSEGTYEKIELHVAAIEGIVDGDEAAVTVPSEKLQITNSFEITGDEPVEFVFDINVVKRGPEGGYNLTPVISKSGVNGKDVDVEEIDDEDDGDEAEDDGAEDDGEGGEADDGEDGDGDGDEPGAGDGGEPDDGD